MKRKLVIAFTIAVLLTAGCAGASYARLTARVHGSFFDSNGVKIHYTDEGRGEPVILVHGFAVNADINWRRPNVTQTLSKHYRVIALDDRGHGLSDKLYDPSGYGTNMADDVVRLMDHLKIEKAHVIGYSMGGFITLKLLTMHPERLITAAPCGAGWEKPTDRGDFRETLAKSLESGNGFRPLLEALTPTDRTEPPAFRAAYINFTMKLLNDEKALAAVIRGMDNLGVTEEQLKANTVPTLSVVGEKDPLRRGVDAMVGVMANHEAVFVQDGDHMTTLGKPDFLKAIEDFLARHAAQANPAVAVNQ